MWIEDVELLVEGEDLHVKVCHTLLYGFLHCFFAG
jgi:hypothetical protein